MVFLGFGSWTVVWVMDPGLGYKKIQVWVTSLGLGFGLWSVLGDVLWLGAVVMFEVG